MGNRASLGISFEQEGTVTQAGTCLKGKILLKVTKPSKGGSNLTLYIHGKEIAENFQSINNNNNKTKTKYERLFFTMRLPLSKKPQQQETIRKPGLYTFPFVIKLPEILPSSTSICYNNNSNSNNDNTQKKMNGKKEVEQEIECYRIQYKIGVILNDTTLKQERYMLVASANLPQRYRVPCSLQPTVLPTIDGRIGFAAAVNDVLIGRGEDLVLYLTCRKETSIDLSNKVHVKVVESIAWGAVDQQQQQQQQTECLVDLKEIYVNGMTKQITKSIGNSPGSVRLMYETIHEDLRQATCQLTISIPTNARDSYIGKLAKIEHYLEVTLVTPPGITVKPSVRIPLHVGSPKKAKEDELFNCSSSVNPVDASHARLGYDCIPPPMPKYEVVPMLTAVTLPHDVVLSPVVYSSDENMKLGGDITIDNNSSSSSSSSIDGPITGILSEQFTVAVNTSIDILLKEMDVCINEYDCIRSKVRDAKWLSFFSNISSENFGQIIEGVRTPYVQPMVATLLIPHVPFDIFFVSAAVTKSFPWIRVCMLERTLHACKDLNQLHEQLVSKLSLWETVVTQQWINDTIE